MYNKCNANMYIAEKLEELYKELIKEYNLDAEKAKSIIQEESNYLINNK